jgi:hypothetical protein
MADRAFRKALLQSVYKDMVDWIDWERMQRRSGFRIVALAFLGLVPLAMFMLGLGLFGQFQTPGNAVVNIALSVPASGGLWLGLQATKAARAELSKFPETALFGHRRPVIYLREFAGENPSLPEAIGRQSGRFWGSFASMMFATKDTSFERQIVKGVATAGQLIALADPLERRRPSDARRLKIRGPDWQSAVNMLLPEASLAVLLYSPGESVSWEARRVIEQSSTPVLVWMPQLLTQDQFQRGVPLEEVLPAWLLRPLRSQTSCGDSIGDPQSSYLCYLDNKRVLTVRQVKNWLRLSNVIKRCLREGEFTGAPNPHRRLPWSQAEAAERIVWVVSFLFGLCLIGAIFYMTNPNLQSALGCVISPAGHVCRDWMATNIEEVMSRTQGSAIPE